MGDAPIEDDHDVASLRDDDTLAVVADSAGLSDSGQVMRPKGPKREAEPLPTLEKKAKKEHYKKHICTFWQAGTCQKVQCSFAHGEEELRR